MTADTGHFDGWFHGQQHPSAGLGVYDLEPADLVTIVGEYFRKYAPEADPPQMSKVRDLLEAASSEKP